MNLNAAVFLDRDGVINKEGHYVHRKEDFVFLPGAIVGLQKLQAAGFKLVIITNQSGIGRGLYSEAQYQSLLRHMHEILAGYGIWLDGVYHCPHHPEHGQGPYRIRCHCRKPQPGMILQAQKDLGINLACSYLIGDKLNDIAAGRAVGMGCCVLVQSGHVVAAKDTAAADSCLPDLQAAADWILNRQKCCKHS